MSRNGKTLILTWLHFDDVAIFQAIVHAEMDAVFGDDDREPSEGDLKKCVYLEKCIKDSLRYFHQFSYQ